MKINISSTRPGGIDALVFAVSPDCLERVLSDKGEPLSTGCTSDWKGRDQLTRSCHSASAAERRSL